jgi:hypothetical protein
MLAEFDDSIRESLKIDTEKIFKDDEWNKRDIFMIEAHQ